MTAPAWTVPGAPGTASAGAAGPYPAPMLICHYDLTSPAATVAVLRLQRVADAGGQVRFSGLDVLGLDVAVPPTLDLLEALPRYAPRAAELGLAMRRPSRRPPTLSAHLVGELADRHERGAAWREHALRAFWERDADLSDTATLVELAVGIGLDGLEVAARVADRAARTRLRQRGVQLRGKGVGDVPVLEVDGTLVSAELGDADLRLLAGL